MSQAVNPGLQIDSKVRIKEAGKGYFHDLNMTRRHGGKTWIAPNVLIKEEVLHPFFFLSRLSLADNQPEGFVPAKYPRQRSGRRCTERYDNLPFRQNFHTCNAWH